MLDNLKKVLRYTSHPTTMASFLLAKRGSCSHGCVPWALETLPNLQGECMDPPPFLDSKTPTYSYMRPRSNDPHMELGLYSQGLGGHTVNLYLYQFYALCLWFFWSIFYFTRTTTYIVFIIGCSSKSRRVIIITCHGLTSLKVRYLPLFS